MFISKARHDNLIAAKDSEIAGLRHGLANERATVDALDRTAKKYRTERDAARAELQVFLDRREKAKQNLRQFKKRDTDLVEAA